MFTCEEEARKRAPKPGKGEVLEIHEPAPGASPRAWSRNLRRRPKPRRRRPARKGVRHDHPGQEMQWCCRSRNRRPAPSRSRPRPRIAFRVENVAIDFNPNIVETDETTGSLDSEAPTIGGMTASIGWDVWLKGSGASATPPDWGELMKACGVRRGDLRRGRAGGAGGGRGRRDGPPASCSAHRRRRPTSSTAACRST